MLCQVLTFILFPKTRGSSSLLAKEFMTTFALLQYVPRVIRIYVACKEFNKTPTTETRIWIFFKGGFSLFLYILTSHVSFVHIYESFQNKNSSNPVQSLTHALLVGPSGTWSFLVLFSYATRINLLATRLSK